MLHAVVDEGDAALRIQRVDDVGRAVHQVAVHALRALEALRNALAAGALTLGCASAPTDISMIVTGYTLR